MAEQGKLDEVWQPAEGHLIEPKCVAHNVKACFTCAVLRPLWEQVDAEERMSAQSEAIRFVEMLSMDPETAEKIDRDRKL